VPRREQRGKEKKKEKGTATKNNRTDERGNPCEMRSERTRDVEMKLQGKEKMGKQVSIAGAVDRTGHMRVERTEEETEAEVRNIGGNYCRRNEKRI
jgi:hypothetical protein